ncbi:MAG: hypothetical protein AAGG44_14630 [Planctomycetota bacterium]
MCVEVALISLQQWRGVESHFNRSTAFDSAVDTWITALIAIVTLCILRIAWRAFTELDVDLDQQIAYRAGLVYLLISCGIGFLILGYGIVRTGAGSDPSIYGNSGVVKFPHGMTIHAIQVLPALGWLLKLVGTPLSSRVFCLHCCNASLGLQLLYSVTQTLSGRDRGDFTPATGMILLAAAISASPVLYALLSALCRQTWRSNAAAK